MSGITGISLTMPSILGKIPRRRERPLNFLVVVSDDQCYRAIGYNNRVVKTPALDRLAGQGIIFDHAYVASPICVASRASLLTGLFPQQHGAIALDPTGFRKSVVEEKRYKTVAHLLAGAGYTTAFCGKSHLGEPRDYGFMLGEEHKDTTDNETFAFVAQFLDQRRGNPDPFFLWVAPRQPHLPLRPGPEWLDLYRDARLEVDPNFLESPPEGSIYNQGMPGQRFFRDTTVTGNYKNLPGGPPRTREMMLDYVRAYYAAVSRLDQQVGQLVAQLEASKLYGHTVIVFLSDNGYLLGNHGLGNKITMHEESVRIPMFIHWNGLSKKQVRCPALVSSLDLVPTVLDLTGVAKPGNLSGLSLAPLFAHPRRQLRKYVASECVGVGGTLGMGHRMVRTGRWKYVLTDVNDEALFDEGADPYEMNNVAGQESNRRTLSRLRRYMTEWMDRIGDTHERPPRTV
ncbi:MAG: sulfatase [Candidatus Hydrogenedentes bacterium]|nr:sulfatase [Candidatus Hydrogenedentota bacterium]